MSANNTLLGNGFIPNLVRLSFLLVVVGFFFGPMFGLWETEYQWLSLVIGGFLVAFVVSVFVSWRIALLFVLGFLVANFVGFQILGATQQTIAARQAYVAAAVGAGGQLPAYAALMPTELQSWLEEFEQGSSNANSFQNEASIDGKKRLLSEPSNPQSGMESSTVQFLATNDVTMDDERFIASYRNLALKHGDWLGYFARCVHSGGESVPLFMPGAKEAVRKAESVGRHLCNFPEDAFGIEPDVARSRFLQRIGASHCDDDNWQCNNVKRDLRSHASTFFPE